MEYFNHTSLMNYVDKTNDLCLIGSLLTPTVIIFAAVTLKIPN
jgi:hypothetical protein